MTKTMSNQPQYTNSSR